MKRKQIGIWAVCMAVLGSLLAVPAMAVDTGVYTGAVITSYYNPDTGKVDDGGTSNAALGEGMCRSATAETGLVEVDVDGKNWLTIRLQLQSNCSNVAFAARTGYDTYSPVTYSITAEDAASDTIDYRFQVTEKGVWLRGTMYVTPMGRDVLWYLHVDDSTLSSGSGDFVVSIDTGRATTSETAGGKETAATPATPGPATTTTSGDSPKAGKPAQTPGASEVSAVAEGVPAPATDPSEALAAEKETPKEEETPAEEQTGESARTNDTASNESEVQEMSVPAKVGDLSGGVVAVIEAMVILAVGAVICFIRRKK